MLTSMFVAYLLCIFCVAFSTEIVNFGEDLDYYKEIVSEKPHLLASLNELLQENKQLSRKDLIFKVAVWSKENNLQSEFAQFVREKRRLYHNELNRPKPQNDDSENEVYKLIYDMARVNTDLNLSFKASCQQQNALLRRANKTVVNNLGFKINIWCESQ